MSEDELKAIRARADACFRAPWTAGSFVVKCEDVGHADNDACEGEHDIERIESPDEYPDGQVIADVPGMEMFSKPHAAFIAAARTDVPALCDEVMRLQGALGGVEQVAGEAILTAMKETLDEVTIAISESLPPDATPADRKFVAEMIENIRLLKVAVDDMPTEVA